MTALGKRLPSIDIGYKIVPIVTTDENEDSAYATGFIALEDDFISLYTCWHVVTGFNPHQIPRKYPPKRKTLKFCLVGKSKPHPEMVAYGGQEWVEINLYNQDGSPTWIQSKSMDLKSDDRIPRLDAIRIRLDGIIDLEDDFYFIPGRHFADDTYVGVSSHISGYPYGYSPLDEMLTPIFISRNKASDQLAHGGYGLLDGAGAKGMSGSPMVHFGTKEWHVHGMYVGSIFPENRYFSNLLENNKYNSPLPLGKYIPNWILRAHLVEDLYR